MEDQKDKYNQILLKKKVEGPVPSEIRTLDKSKSN